MALKLLFLKKFSALDMEYLSRNLLRYYKFILPENFSKEKLVSLAREADVFLGNEIFKELIDAATNLKLIQIAGTGIDKINIEPLKKKNIFICNSHSNAPYVAEHAIALLFSLLKKIHIHHNLMRNGIWFRPQNNKRGLLYQSNSIIGKTVGFLGFGNIAENIARFLSGFKVDYIACRKKGVSCLNHDRGLFKVDFLDLERVLAKSDILFVALPLTKETQDMISTDEFKLMKKTAYLINVSRAAVINEKALYKALAESQIAGAAIDVWYDDLYSDGKKIFPSKEYPFHKLKNIVLSPHRAGCINGYSPHLTDIVKNLIAFATKNEIVNAVDIKAGY